MMPNYQPNPYMEPPGFVIPHTHLHLMDYRRMLNPQYYQTMAYHSRRFRYQHNSQTREMTSSEVQTEPLSATQRTSTPSSSKVEASRSSPTSQPLSPALVVQKLDHSLELKDAVPPSTSTTRTTPNGSFVIQTEEVRIECCTTPGGLQLLHSHETAEVSHGFSQDMVQCSSILQGGVLQDKGLCLPADESENSLQSCPDILLVGTPSSGETIPALEESNQTGKKVAAPAHGDAQDMSGEKDLSSKNFQFRAVHMPYDSKYLDELRKMESTVWSMEDTLIPSPESLFQNDQTESHDEEAEVPSTDVLTVRENTPTDEVVPMIEMPSLTADELEDAVPTMEGLEDEVCPVAEETLHAAEVDHAPYLLLSDYSPLKAKQPRREQTLQDHQDTSFESLPAYLPSTSWLADFDNVYYCSKLPPTPKKQNRPPSNRGLDVPSRRRKLDLEYKEQPPVRKPKERYKPKGKVDRRSLSDHECCISRNFNENVFTPYVLKRERLCTRCLAKRRLCTPSSPGLDGRNLQRKVPFQQRNDALLPTCEACKSHSTTGKQLMRKAARVDVCGRHLGHETEGESSENSSCRTKWRAADDLRKLNDLKRPLASKQNVDTRPAVMYPKLKEKNCGCNEPQHQSATWERLRHCPHGNAIRQMDENCGTPVSLQDKWTHMDQTYQTQNWQTGKQMRISTVACYFNNSAFLCNCKTYHPAEKSQKAVMTNLDVDGSKNEARSQHFNKHKRSQPQSQGLFLSFKKCVYFKISLTEVG